MGQGPAQLGGRGTESEPHAKEQDMTDRTSRTRNRRSRAVLSTALLAGLTLLAGCSSFGSGLSLPSLNDINPFAEKEEKLPGKRIAVIKQVDITSGEIAEAAKPVALPPMVANVAWSQPGGVPSNAPGHLALAGALKTLWRSDAGEGSSSDGRLIASPIVYEGRVYVLDSHGAVSAFSAGSGSRIWRVSLTPENEKDEEGYGGGLAADQGRIYAATGFGTVVALDPRSGRKLWEKTLGVPMRASPSAAGGRVFVTTIEGRFYALSGADGSEIWSFRGVPERASLLTNVSPAVSDDIVVVPYPSGDVVALSVASGEPLWSDSLASSRSRTSLTSLSNPSRPVIDGSMVFAVGHSGRMIAAERKSGARVWSRNIRGTQPPWVAGDAVYVVDVGGRLLALTRGQGKLLWVAKMPGGGIWSGPVLAGGRLWLASSKGLLVGVDARTGTVAAKRDLGEPVYIAPVVADGRMYVLTDDAKLLALR